MGAGECEALYLFILLFSKRSTCTGQMNIFKSKSEMLYTQFEMKSFHHLFNNSFLSFSFLLSAEVDVSGY